MTQTSEARNIRLLVIEDNPADVELLRWALEAAHVKCELIVLEDGGEALAFIQQRGKYADRTPPDLAIVDLNLPKYDGLEILEAMRATPGFESLPVAVLSSSSSPRDRSRMEAFHIASFITKPPDLDEYLQIGDEIRKLIAQQ
jgi:CheY-like chemotaxis protein